MFDVDRRGIGKRGQRRLRIVPHDPRGDECPHLVHEPCREETAKHLRAPFHQQIRVTASAEFTEQGCEPGVAVAVGVAMGWWFAGFILRPIEALCTFAERLGKREIQGHQDAKTLQKWQELFTRLGFAIEQVLPDQWPRARFRQLLPWWHPKPGRKEPVAKPVVPLRWCNELLFVMRKSGATPRT